MRTDSDDRRQSGDRRSRDQVGADASRRGRSTGDTAADRRNPSSGKRGNGASTERKKRTDVSPERNQKRPEAGKSGRKGNPSNRRSAKQGMSMGMKIALTVIVAIAVLLTVVILLINGTLNRIHRVDKNTESFVSRSDETFDTDSDAGSDTMQADEVNWNNVNVDVMKDKDVSNILLIGQDRRDGEGRTRSDSMIIVSVNKDKDEIILTSIMRDMYVPIPGYSDNRINSAYMLGGMTLLDEVIENSFGIHIDGNVEVDFDGFVEAMTQVGSLNVELTAEEAEYLNTETDWVEEAGYSGEGWTLHAGMNALTPEQALAYARTRYVGNSDYERTERQRKVLIAAYDNVKKLSITEQVALAAKILPYFTTDMGNDEILGYVYTIYENHMTIPETHRIPVDGAYTDQTINGMQVLVPDLAANAEYLQEYIYGDGTDTDTDTQDTQDTQDTTKTRNAQNGTGQNTAGQTNGTGENEITAQTVN